MRFLYPLGFLALIGVPVLILIYIIKNRYTEQTVASTYLWTLSERFIKRRVPINRITGIINLILQILAVVAISVILAHPVVYLPGQAKAYCFVLDGSGSMNVEQNGQTRFDIGKERIEKIIHDAVNGSTYTLIYAGDGTDVIYTDLTDKSAAVDILNKLSVSYASNKLTDARQLAQRYFNDNPWAETYLITDRAYAQTANLTVINVAASVQNYSVADVSYLQKDGALLVVGKVISHDSDATLTLKLYFDDSSEAFSTLSVETVRGEETPFEFRCVNVDQDGTEKPKLDFGKLKVVIDNEDALSIDNEITVFNVIHENVARTLIVSADTGNNPSFFVTAALTAAGYTQFDVIKADEYSNQTGYGLYIFDGYTPDEMPKEGAVWFINPQKSLNGSNFSYQGEVVARYPAKYSTSTSTVVRKQLEGALKLEFELYGYVKVGLNGKFTTLITCDGSPILFTGTNTYGNREVVFAFDFHSSAQFTMLPDVNILIKNMLSYSFPEVVESAFYYCGDVAQVNMVAGCESIIIETPNGNALYPDTTTAVSEFTLSEVGIYRIRLIMKDRTERTVSIYAAMPLDECAPTVADASFAIQGQPEQGFMTGFMDNLLVIFLILAVIAVADYGVYSYEQWQLR